MKKRPLIFITNDDGIDAKGINELVKEALKYADVFVVAPNGPRSAQSSALTIETPISAVLLEETERLTRYAVSGTPADCVKLAIDQLLPRKPDLLLSGINHGSNASINVIYSGTVGAAIEGALHDVPSIGFSLWNHKKDADFSFCVPFFGKIIEKALAERMPKGICLNVNAPQGEIKGIQICRQSSGRWSDEFKKDDAPRSVPYFWLIGDFLNDTLEAGEHPHVGDQKAMEEGYVSIVPIHTDMTAYHVMSSFKGYETIR